MQCRRCYSPLELSTIYFCEDKAFCCDCWSRSWENPKNASFLANNPAVALVTASNSSAFVQIPRTSSMSILNSARSSLASIESADSDSIAHASLSDTPSDCGDLEQAPDDDETFAMDSFDREVEPAKFAPTVSPASVIKTSSVIDRTAPSAPTPVPNLRDERERANSL